jgi:hypothetical protein
MSSIDDINGETHPPLLPPPPPLPTTSQIQMDDARQTYLNSFNQILERSININCICKTTKRRKYNKNDDNNVNTIQKLAKRSINEKNVFDANDFMNDDDDDDDDDHNDGIEMIVDSDQDDLQINFNHILYELQLDDDDDKNNYKSCDFSCFEYIRHVYLILKCCFKQQDTEKALKSFDKKWSLFRFLNNKPNSCDYFGTTLFHYAASDNNCSLLESLLKKYADGVFCVDSKGFFFFFKVSF